MALRTAVVALCTALRRYRGTQVPFPKNGGIVALQQGISGDMAEISEQVAGCQRLLNRYSLWDKVIGDDTPGPSTVDADGQLRSNDSRETAPTPNWQLQ